VLAAVVLLGGCTQIDAAFGAANTLAAGEIKTAHTNVAAALDNAATLAVNALCDIPYSEVVRNGTGNPNFAAAVTKLCGSPAGTTVIQSSPAATAVTTIPTTVVQAAKP
jgi:hypothetical protein